MPDPANVTSPAAPARRFRDQTNVFGNGVKGEVIDIPSASPRNYYQAISAPAEMPETIVDGQLFMPTGRHRAHDGKVPLILIAPGSFGVAASHLAHAEALNAAGFATFMLDSFGARNVTSTVANQTQFSFAASAYDVLAAVRVFSARPGIDPHRIGAQGHSRGGTAVLTAATRRFANAMIPAGNGLRAILAAYPWCGHQFVDPSVGTTAVHFVMGDADEWCSPMQAQGHFHAIRATSNTASWHLIGGAQHGFDRGPPLVMVADASVSPSAPVAYIANDGAFCHPLSAHADASLTDRDLMIYGLKAGFGRTGAKLGGRDGDAALFTADMLRYWNLVLGGGA